MQSSFSNFLFLSANGENYKIWSQNVKQSLILQGTFQFKSSINLICDFLASERYIQISTNEVLAAVDMDKGCPPVSVVTPRPLRGATDWGCYTVTLMDPKTDTFHYR